MTTHVVYRLYDAFDELIYVGSTNDFGRRLNEHQNTKRWGDSIVRWTVSEPMPRADALRAEYQAIRAERPWFNRRRPPNAEPTFAEMAEAINKLGSNPGTACRHSRLGLHAARLP